MKKWILSFTALFIAVAASAQSLYRYIPADSTIIGTVDGTRYIDSKFINKLHLVLTQKSISDRLKEQGKTMAQAKKETGHGVFFVKIKAVKPQLLVEGGVIVKGIDKDSFAKIKNITRQSLDAELKKNQAQVNMLTQMGVKYSIVKVAGRNSIMVSLANPAIECCITGITNDQFQARFSIGAPVVKALFTPQKNYSALTKELDSKSLVSLAANVPFIAKLSPEMQQDPVAKSLKTSALSIKEVNNDIVIQAVFKTNSPDSAKMIHAQINAVFETMKADPANKALAEKFRLNIAGSNVTVKAPIPVDFIITGLMQAVAAGQGATPAAAPAAK